MVPSLKKHTLPVEGSVDSKKLELMVLNVVLFTEPVTEPFVLLNGPVANVCVRLLGRHKMFVHEKGACRNDKKTFSLQLYGFA